MSLHLKPISDRPGDQGRGRRVKSNWTSTIEEGGSLEGGAVGEEKGVPRPVLIILKRRYAMRRKACFMGGGKEGP